MAASRKSSVERDFTAAVKLASEHFPGIEVVTSYRTPGIKVKGKFMARLRTEAEGWLAIRCDFVDREILLQSAPHVFHLTPHYQNYPMILVDLAAIDQRALLEVLERGWRLAASKKAIRELDEQRSSVPSAPAPAKKRPVRKKVARKSQVHRPVPRVAGKPISTLDVRTRAAWRAWLSEHHRSATEIWLVFHKRHTDTPSVDYEDAIEEALCFGWVDRLVRRLDDDRYARKFTPRQTASAWSMINRRRYASLKKRGLLEEAGHANAPGTKVAVAPPRQA